MKSNTAYQNNSASFFSSLSPVRLLAGTGPLVQLCPGRRRMGTACLNRLASSQVESFLPKHQLRLHPALLTPTGAFTLCVCCCDVTRPNTRFPEQRKS